MSGGRGRAFDWPEGRRAAVSLSFDDARLSQVDRGMTILDACGARATFYVSIAGVEERLEAWRLAVAGGHEIGEAGIRQTTDAAAPEALCGYCLDPAGGIWLDTVAAVGKYIRETRGS